MAAFVGLELLAHDLNIISTACAAESLQVRCYGGHCGTLSRRWCVHDGAARSKLSLLVRPLDLRDGSYLLGLWLAGGSRSRVSTLTVLGWLRAVSSDVTMTATVVAARVSAG